MAADGSVIFDVNLNITKAERDLAKLKADMAKTNQTISEQEDKKAPLVEQAEDLNAQIKEATAEAKRFGEAWKNGVSGADKDQSMALEKVAQLQAQYNGVVAQIDKIDKKLMPAYEKLDGMKEKAGGLEQRIAIAAKNTKDMADATSQADTFLDKFTKRVKGLAKRVFIFSMITAALRHLRSWMGSVVDSNDEASAAMARLRGALLTLAQPLVNVLIPAFTMLVNILTAVVGAIASVLSALFGTTVEASAQAAENLYDEQNAIKGVGSAAKKAGKSLASFDEINKLSGSQQGGGGAGGANVKAPDFEWANALSDKLKEIADLILLIGAGFLLWKLSNMLPGALGTIASTLGLILMLVGGLILAWHGLTDAWENGVDWLNLIEMVGGLAIAAFALYKLLGTLATGILLVVGGLALLATGLHDAFKNGFNLKNTLLTISGIIATGLGIAFLTGSAIPALIAAILSILVALTVATGHGGELIEGLRKIMDGFVKFVKGIFSGDLSMALAGIENIFDGLGQSVGAVIDGIKDTFNSLLNWLDEKTGGKLHGIITAAQEFVTGFFTNLKATISNWISGVKLAFQGIIQFLTGVFTADWDAAWEGVKNIFKGVWNANIALVEGAANKIIDGVNWIISQLNKIHFEFPDWVPGVGGKSFGINITPLSKVALPRLAQGAVIPPNREFMAVLGDQKSGTNIETPLETMIQAFRTALNDMNAGQGEAVMMVDDEVFGRLAYRLGSRESNRIGTTLVEGRV